MKHLFIIMLNVLFTTACSAQDSSSNMSIDITIGGVTNAITLADTRAAQELAAKLQDGSITVTLNDNGGFEIWGALGFSLPTSNQQMTAQPGDVVLYSGSNICIFYGSNSWSYTRLGKIEGITATELRSFLKGGQRNISVTLSLSPSTGISHVTNDVQHDMPAYKLNGQLAQSNEHGIVIKGGKKFILK